MGSLGLLSQQSGESQRVKSACEDGAKTAPPVGYTGVHRGFSRAWWKECVTVLGRRDMVNIPGTKWRYEGCTLEGRGHRRPLR